MRTVSWPRRTFLAMAAIVTMQYVVAVPLATQAHAASYPTSFTASSVGGQISESEVMARAKYWYDRGDTWYSTAQEDAISDGDDGYYRPDCSGLVSMTWHLPKKSNGWDLNTSDFWSGLNNGSVPYYGGPLWHALSSRDLLLPGDGLLTSGHMELFEKWVNPSDHTQGAWVYSENTWGQKTNHDIDYNGEMSTYTPIRYNNMKGTASIYGTLSDGRLTYTTVDAVTGNRTKTLVSTATLGFTPKAMATLNFNTLLITSTAGRLYRVDVITNNTSLTFNTPSDLGGGWTHDRLAYDGPGYHLYGIAAGVLYRYTIIDTKPGPQSIVPSGNYGTGFSLTTLTATGPDWVMGLTSGGALRSYHLIDFDTWVGYTLSSRFCCFNQLISPGAGIYYGRTTSGAMYHYLDTYPYDGSGNDIQYYGNDPVDTSGWTQTLLSAQPSL